MADPIASKTWDVAIVGAGILGCSLAVALGNQGRTVLVIERDLSEPDRIVGELLQPGGVAALTQLGLRGGFSCSAPPPRHLARLITVRATTDCLDGIDAIPVYGYECIYHGKRVNIPYPARPDGTRQEGRAFHHGRFVQKLREAARRTPK